MGSTGGPPKFRLPQQPANIDASFEIPIATPRDPDVEFLVNENGVPVWPVNSEEEKTVIADVAALFGGTITEATAFPGACRRISSELVVGVGTAADEAALYAHLTHRRAAEVQDVAELASGALPAVVLFCGEILDRELVQFLSLATFDEQAPGIIWARSLNELHIKVLGSACAAALNGAIDIPHLELVGPDIPIPETKYPIDELRRKLAAGVGLLSVHGHSDGIAHHLGGGAALCARTADDSRGSEMRAPECVYTGHCKVLDRPVTEVLKRGALISPASIAARVMLALGCHSAYLGNKAIDQSWSIFPQLVANPHIGALLAIPELSFGIRPIQAELIEALKGGEPVGRAVTRFEESPAAQDTGYRPLLFGDPRIRAMSATGLNVIKLEASPIDPPRKRGPSFRDQSGGESSRFADLELLRGIAFTSRKETKGRGAITSKEVIAQLTTLEGEEDWEAAIAGEVGYTLRKAILEHLETTKVRLFEAWLPSSIVSRADEVLACPQCGWRARPLIVTMSAGAQREFMICPYCSDVRDSPMPRQIDLSIELPRVTCKWTHPPKAWAAAVYVVRTKPIHNRMIMWPRNADDSPAGSVELDAPISPPGPARVYAVWIDGLSVYSQAAMAAGVASAAIT